jgi:hypothetical protein
MVRFLKESLFVSTVKQVSRAEQKGYFSVFSSSFLEEVLQFQPFVDPTVDSTVSTAVLFSC